MGVVCVRVHACVDVCMVQQVRSLALRCGWVLVLNELVCAMLCMSVGCVVGVGALSVA